MSLTLKYSLIVLALFLEFAFCKVYFLAWQHSAIGGTVSYRHEERLKAYRDYLRDGSPDTKAVFDREMDLMLKHEAWKIYLSLGLIVIADGIGIYYFISYGRRKTVA
jgi:hypothetical protein